MKNNVIDLNVGEAEAFKQAAESLYVLAQEFGRTWTPQRVESMREALYEALGYEEDVRDWGNDDFCEAWETSTVGSALVAVRKIAALTAEIDFTHLTSTDTNEWDV